MLIQNLYKGTTNKQKRRTISVMIEVADDIVNLSDDDNVAGINQTRKMKKKVRIDNFDVIETIDLDQLSSPQKSRQSNNIIFDLCNGVNENNKKPPDWSYYLQEVYEDNRLLAEFIEKCLNLEHSEGMTRIINKTLMRIYGEMEEDYKCSRHFERTLLKATMSIECDPDHKFFHLKNLCETMKQHKAKKRVELYTLPLDSKENGVKRNCSKFDHTQYKKQKVHIIDSDDEEDIPVINLEDDHNQNDLIILDETQNEADKENEHNHNSESDTLLEPQLEVYWDPNVANSLEPPVSPRQPQDLSEDEQVKVKVKELENEIAECKRLITMYDTAEVDLDSTTSPYIKSEKLKSKAVRLYKELCDLTGHSPVKRRKVKLEVLEGHPIGPVKKLEMFLNSLGKNGKPRFPDFNDVIKCVIDANVESDLSWTRQKVLKEATALFIYCGRELQRQRQQRDYKYLLSQINQEDHDPADDDLELRARLDANRLIAKKKEDDIFERYAKMESLSTRIPTPCLPSDLNSSVQTNLPDPDSQSDGEDDSDAESDTEDTEKDMSNGNTLENHIQLEVPNDKVPVPEVTAKTETECVGIDCNANNEPRMGRVLTKPLEIETMTVNAETKNNDNRINFTVNYNSQIDMPIEDMETEYTLSIDNGVEEGEGSPSFVETDGPIKEEFEIDTNIEPIDPIQLNSEIIIKKEPEENIVKRLEDLGDDFTVLISDIEDPFVSIEISDSSDDESEN